MHYAFYDVFAPEAFAGNQALVVRTEGMATAGQLQALAAEFNVAEACHYRLDGGMPRIAFATSAGPIAVCGHGLLAVLADVALYAPERRGESNGFEIVGRGISDWTCDVASSRIVSISARWPGTPEYRGALAAPEAAEILGIGEDMIPHGQPLGVVDSGIRHAVVPVRDEQALLAVRPSYGEAMKRYFREHGLADMHVYCLTGTPCSAPNGIHVRTRNVFPYGVKEESATGSASVALASLLLAGTARKSAQCEFEQGVARRGAIVVKRDSPQSDSKEIFRLSGQVVRVASGEDILIPSNIDGHAERDTH